MKINSLLMVCLILFQISQGLAQRKSSSVNEKDLREMYFALEKDSILRSLITDIGDPETVLKDYIKRSLKSDSLWTCQQRSLKK